MKTLWNKLVSWFTAKDKTEDTLRDLQMRVMGLEQDVHHLKGLLNTDSISLAGMSKESHTAHFDTLVSASVMKWLANWLNDYSFSDNDNFKEEIESLVEDAISDNSFVEDACQNWSENNDWDYQLRDSLDWDKVAEKVAEKLDWDTIISDNELVTNHDIDTNDVMLKSEHLSEDEVVTKGDLSDAVVQELKRDWFAQLLKEDVLRIFKETLYTARQNEEANCRNAIDDEIVSKVDTLVAEELQKKFGESFDIWFHNLIAHSVKQVISEMIAAAHQQVIENEGDSNV